VSQLAAFVEREMREAGRRAELDRLLRLGDPRAMALLPPNLFGPTQTNLTAAARVGTTITAAASAHTKGAYSAGQLIASTNEDTYAVTITAHGRGAAAIVSSCLLDIGIGPSGSEVDLIQDLDCWGAPVNTATITGAKSWLFPVFIPKGTRIAARCQTLLASGTVIVIIDCHQAASGWGMEVPTKWERLGVVTNSNGVSVTPASGAFGAWTTILDPITKNYRWWHVGFDALADTTIAVQTNVLLELGIGDTSAAVTTIGSWAFGKDTGERILGPYPSTPVFQPLVDDDAKGVFTRLAAGGVEPRGVLVYAGE
jgi:hypothetical protein